MVALTKEQEQAAKEQQMAKLLGTLEEMLGPTGVTGMVERIKAIETRVEALKGLDPSKVLESLEALKTGQQKVADAIRRSRNGGYFSGIEDVAKDFSILRACVGFKRFGAIGKKGAEERWKDGGFGDTFEVLHQSHEKMLETYQKAGIRAGDDSSMGSFIPDQLLGDIIAAVYTKSVFINLEGAEGETSISVIDGLQGLNVRVNQFKGGMVAYWLGEEDVLAESVVKSSDKTMNAKKLGIMARITEEMFQFGGYGWERFFRNDMIRALAKKLDLTMAYGRGGSNVPLGMAFTPGINLYSAQSGKFETWSPGVTNLANTTNFQADWQGAELNFDALDNMDLISEEVDRDQDETHKTISGRRFFKRLKQIKVDNYSTQAGVRAPYLIGMPMLPDARLAEIIGPFGKTNQIKTQKPGASIGAPSATGTVSTQDVFRGNLGSFVLGRWGNGLLISDDGGQGVGFASGATLVKATAWFDTFARYPEDITLCPDAKVL